MNYGIGLKIQLEKILRLEHFMRMNALQLKQSHIKTKFPR